MFSKIISGGQTGADIAGIDAAIAKGVEYGGTLPKGRTQELNKTVPAHYTKFVESTRKDYLTRTRLNVQNADGTVVFVYRILKGGSAKTVDFACVEGKPVLVLDMREPVQKQAQTLCVWAQRHTVQVLNVAGSRASKEPTIYAFVRDVIMDAIENYNTHTSKKGFGFE